jgi:hypothetical protein
MEDGVGREDGGAGGGAAVGSDKDNLLRMNAKGVIWMGTKLSLCTLSLCASVGLALATRDNRPQSYPREITLAREAGLAVFPSDIRPKLPPPEQNAASLYHQIHRLQKERNWTKADEKVITAVANSKPATPQQEAAATRLLRSNRTILELMHKAAMRPYCVYRRDYSLGPALAFPEFLAMRSSARWLMAESHLQLRAGKTKDAINTAALGFQIGRHASSDPIVTAHLVATAIDAITLAAHHKILWLVGERPGVSDAVRRSIEAHWKPHSLAYSLRGESTMTYVVLQHLRRGDFAFFDHGTSPIGTTASSKNKPFKKPAHWDETLDRNGAYVLFSLRQLTRLADKPYPEAIPVFKEQGQTLQRGLGEGMQIAEILTLKADDFLNKKTTLQARVNVTSVAAALIAYKLKRAGLPKTLEEAISPVPADPFNLKPLRYRRDASGFVVWSVGPSLKFNGGNLKTKPAAGEAVFYYPMPAYLREATPAK